jgi:hypothetical protein
MLDASFLQADDSDPHVNLAVGGVSSASARPQTSGEPTVVVSSAIQARAWWV